MQCIEQAIVNGKCEVFTINSKIYTESFVHMFLNSLQPKQFKNMCLNSLQAKLFIKNMCTNDSVYILLFIVKLDILH